MTLQEVIQQRNITRLFHFTHSDNLSSILENGLLSRSELDDEVNEYSYDFNDEDRIDGHLDAICLSISFPNAKMFWKYRSLKPGNWVILEINPSILWTKNCAFYPTNAASNNVRFNDLELMKGNVAFSALFSDEVFGIQRDANLPSEYTTDVQAEVLVFEKIDPSYIVNTFHPNKQSAEHFKGLYPQTHQRYYANLNGRTLYSQRHYYLG
ncbi:DUF4433 domain-containing protein [Escherichia coli]|uniref:DarT ssDNA thymidine ADP-ribosyltransferase family protein n=1 Tax=Citrobacter sp. wls718 TaxID=2576418 RepID=UPI000E0537AF|nr:DarT ssDNA thymidine ADP-ribosyltransferase family protein [Citrobacter sp. wls718]EFE3693789.1 DUF4433 domain-containing protein [Escherichia coli]EFJ9879374.1 DUF4433 domain-containing protein [Escherichia coli]EHC2535230.1 DUF4433 domain-containing protein [Escherichia coli]EHZ8348464.1 DUF4433 domain-containing protein [Escherichia coli]TKU25806.1 DUF4433 domain-containing protein [Citrobacter sp. wls718]